MQPGKHPTPSEAGWTRKHSSLIWKWGRLFAVRHTASNKVSPDTDKNCYIYKRRPEFQLVNNCIVITRWNHVSFTISNVMREKKKFNVNDLKGKLGILRDEKIQFASPCTVNPPGCNFNNLVPRQGNSKTKPSSISMYEGGRTFYVIIDFISSCCWWNNRAFTEI